MVAQKRDASPDGIAPPKLMDAAYLALEKMIVTGALAPGQWVSETELVELSGFSRAPVRSALQRLAHQQLLCVHPRRGAQIQPIDFTQQFRILELRRPVEKLVARSAALRATKKHKQQFAEFAEAFRLAGKHDDTDAVIALDSGNFALIIEAADNAFAGQAMLSVKGLSRRFWILNHERHGDTEKLASANIKVIEAICAGDPDAAEQAVDALIDYIEKFTMQVIGYNPA